MITVDSKSRSNRYRIMESAVSFTENYQNTNLKGNPIYDVVSVSIANNASIMVYDTNNGIDFGADLQYKRWRLSGATTGLASPEAHNIYAKLSKSNDNLVGEIIFSTLNYTTEGISEETNEEGNPLKDYSDRHWMIKIGTLSALTNSNSSTPDRTLTFDPGQLGTQKDNNEKGAGLLAKMFDLVMTDPERIKPLLWFEELSVKFESFFESIANFYSGIRIGSAGNSKELTSVATDASADEDDDKAISTPAYVKAFSEARYLRYDITSAQTVSGPVTFAKDVDVVGAHSVGGDQSIGGGQSVVGSQTIGRNQTIGGSQEVKGLQTLHGGFVTNNFSDVGGQITGAQLTQAGVFSVAGLKAMSFEIFELIYNNIRAVDGKLSLSSTGVVEHCEIVLLGSGLTITPEDFYAEESDYTIDDIDYLWLTFKEDDYNKGLLQFTHNDILYGYVNQIGESGQYARGGQSCMYVLSTNEEIADANAEKNGQRKMTIKVKLFADDITDENGNLIYDNQNQVVGNMSPTIGMSLAHRGNINGNYPERMTSFFIDSQSGNIVMLQNVMTPQINKGHYGVIVGKLPTDLYNEVRKYYSYIRPYDPVVYAKYGIFENTLEFDHLGNPIQRENNRGEWSAETANDTTTTDGKPLDEEGNTNSYKNRYKNMPSYYDTVTYLGSLYKCVESDTTDVPGQGDGWLLLVAKGEQGEQGERGEKGEKGSDGTSIHIKGSYSSVDAFLAAWQNTDGSWKAPADENDCFVVVYNLYVWDGSSWIDVGQFKGADGKSYAGNLLDNTDFSKVGEDGIPTYWEKSTVDGTFDISVQERIMLISAQALNYQKLISQSLSGKLFESSWYTLSFYIKTTDVTSSGAVREATVYFFVENHDINAGVYHDDSVNYSKYYEYISVRANDQWKRVSFTFKTLSEAADVAIGFGVYRSRSTASVLITQPKVEYVENQDSPSTAQATYWTLSATDLKGKDGKTGASIYLAGAWDSERIYKKENNCTPVVSYTSVGAEKKYYYILNVDESQGSAPDQLVHWKAFQYFQYLWAEFLLAEFATLGGENGAVFYDRYQFSQRGHGNKRYSDYASTMFDPNGKFTGNYIPKLHFDFVSGLANLSCLCEPYNTPTPENGVIRINMDEGFNIKVPYPYIDLNTYTSPYAMMPVVVLPQFIDGEEWAKNGSHVTVLFESGGEDYGNFINAKSGSALLRKSLFLLVCVDDPMQQVDGISYPSFSWSGENYIMHKGRRSKYIIIAPGNSVRFKATETNGCLYWNIDAEASVTEQKVDIYSILSGENLPEHGEVIYPEDYRRVQFHGADYSTISNLSSSYYDDSGTTRGLMLYAGMEGFCPRNIIFSTSNDGEFHYRILSQSDIDGDFVSMYGPTLSN